MAWGKPSFPGESAFVRERLAADRAHDSWVRSGGLDRIRSVVADWRTPRPVYRSQRARLTDGPAASVEAVCEYPGTLGNHAGRIRSLADFDAEPVRNLDTEPAAVLGRNRLAAMSEIMLRDTGNAVTPEKAADATKRRDELRRQTVEIARRLESQGVQAFRKTDFALFTYFVHSGTVVLNDQLRRIMFLPSVAAQCRSGKVRELECFLERNPFARMFTFTSGPRTPLPELGDKVRRFHRNLSRLASWMRRTYGVEMVFRSTELGRPEIRESGQPDGEAGTIDRDLSGVPTFHVHAHTLVWQRRPMSKHAWSAFMKAVWEKWGFFWDDGQSVRDARELCKYVTKPAAVLKLTDAELAALAKQLERLRLVAPMGTLREQIRDRRAREMRLDRMPTPDGRVFREVTDWNRHAPGDKSDRNRERLLKCGVIVPDVDDVTAAKLADTFESRRKRPETFAARIVARLPPAFAPGSILAEPRVCVLAVRIDAAEVARNPLVAHLRELTAADWSAARAVALRVHVCTSTVPADFPAVANWSTAGPPCVPAQAET